VLLLQRLAAVRQWAQLFSRRTWHHVDELGGFNVVVFNGDSRGIAYNSWISWSLLATRSLGTVFTKTLPNITQIEFAMNINFYQTLPNHMWLKSVEALPSCSVSDCFRNHHPAPKKMTLAGIRNLAWFGRRQSVDDMGISWLYHATGENMGMGQNPGTPGEPQNSW